MIYLKKEIRKKSIIYFMFYLILQSLALLSPLIMQKIVDDYIPQKNVQGIIVGIIAFILIPLISTIMRSFYNYFMLKYIQKLSHNIDIKVMENIVYQGYCFYDEENSLKLLSYSSQEARDYIYFYIEDLPQMIVNTILCICIIVYMIFVNSIIGLIQLLYFPLCFLPMKLLNKSIEKQTNDIIETNAEINKVKGEILRSNEYIKLNSLESKKIDEVREKNFIKEKIFGRLAVLDNLTGIWCNGLMSVIFTGITFGISAIFVSSDSIMTTGQLVSILNYSISLYTYFNIIMIKLILKKKNDVKYAHLLKYININGERECETGKKQIDIKNSIIFRNLTFKYPKKDKPALENLSIELPIGLWTNIKGESGCGKTTILNLIIKLYNVEDGCIFFDEVDINQLSAFSIRRKIAKVSQNIFLYDGTIRYNFLLCAPDSSDEDIVRVLKKVRLYNYVLALPHGLDSNIGELGKLMSGGERQRLSLAIALLRNSEILLLDEVTANLDDNNETEILSIMKELRDSGITIVSVSHRREFDEYADKTIQL